VGTANVKPHPRRDIRASRHKRKPDMNTIESCPQFTKTKPLCFIFRMCYWTSIFICL